MRVTIRDSAGNEQVIDLSEDQVRDLQKIANRKGIDFARALQDSIAAGSFLESVQAEGGKVLVEKDNQVREVVREVQTV